MLERDQSVYMVRHDYEITNYVAILVKVHQRRSDDRGTLWVTQYTLAVTCIQLVFASPVELFVEMIAVLSGQQIPTATPI